MADTKPSISLTIQLKDGQMKVLEFTTNDPIMVGSGASSHVKLEGDDVSSLHCMLKPRDGKVFVLDLGSDEGTELNGKELKGETALEDGDIVTVGKARLTVHFGGDLLAPTVPIRRAAVGHAVATEEATVPLREIAVDKKLDEKKVEARLEEKKAEEKKAEPKLAAKAEEKKPEPKLAAKAEEKKPEPQLAAKKTDEKKDDKKVEAKKPEEPKLAAKEPSKEPRLAAKVDQTEVVRKNGAPARTATSMEPRQARPRDVSTSGFKLGKVADHRAKRKIEDTGGEGATLVPTLTNEFKPTDKRDVDVTAVWGGTVIGVARASVGKNVTIGDSPTASFRISHPAIPSPNYPLVTLSGTGAVVQAASGMELFVNDKPASGSVNLETGQKVRVVVGPIELVVQYSKKSPMALMGPILDIFYSKILAVALILQMGLIVALLITPIIPGLDDDDLFKNQSDFTKLILAAQEKKKEKKEDLSGKKAAKAKDDAGVFGKKDKPKEDKLASKKGAPTVDKDKREEDRKIAMDALAALGLKGPEGAVSNVFGPGGLGSGVNNALGGLKGASMGDAGGAGGLGSRGTGAGGGGNGLGIGGLGSGTGRGSGGNGNIDLGGRGKGTTKIIPGKIIYEGGLSREEIQRVISRVMSQIKYCYEKELNKDPNLEGKLVMFWLISGSGDVTTASASQNTFAGGAAAPVEQCVTRIIQRLKFPSPKGGGVVNVTYPFVFAASGG
ncbi:MAG: AgmX/PglI C-terminal domain-containing protein [Deltaproteobacteria bacterium]|nr:AgmX/PglI C-terminal domain-containing protein [Deltaproteobacteria bacterium]